MNTLTTLASIATTSVALAAAATAAAAPQALHEEPSATVYVADLDLDSAGDAQALYERIDYAARSVCESSSLSFDTKRRLHWQQCVEATVADAVERVGAPLLTAIHLQQRAQLART
jgi:UrcA family protein